MIGIFFSEFNTYEVFYDHAVQHTFILHAIKLWQEHWNIWDWLTEVGMCHFCGNPRVYVVGGFPCIKSKFGCYFIHEFGFDHQMLLIKNLVLRVQVLEFDRITVSGRQVKYAWNAKKCRCYMRWCRPECKESPCVFYWWQRNLEVFMVEETGVHFRTEAALYADVLSFLNANVLALLIYMAAKKTGNTYKMLNGYCN